MNSKEYISRLLKKFEPLRNKENAVQMAAYMKDQFPFLGIKTPERTAATKEFIRENGLPDSLPKSATAFMKAKYRELTYAGIDVVASTKKDWSPDSVSLFESMIPINSWWDSVDSINTRCLRPFFKDFPEELDSVSLRWAESDNFWFQRVSLICQLRARLNMDLEVVNRNIHILKESEEFFVQKAIGWILRDYAHDDPEWVREYVAEVELKPLSKREALKNI